MKLGLLCVAFLLAIAGLFLRPEPDWRFVVPPTPVAGTGEEFETVFDYTSPLGVAHAPAISVREGGLDLMWFDGLRESHNDVVIRQARIPFSTGPVPDSRVLLSRQQISAAMQPRQTILTLGNTITDARTGGHFVTVVTLGGWAAASVAHWDGARAQARKLNLSPFIARSHLVKSPVVAMRNGYRMLPAYFEVSEGYGVAALIDGQNRVRAQSDMRGDFAGIQPMIVPLSEQSAVALLLKFDLNQCNMLVSRSEDGVFSWSPAKPTNIANPNAPVAAVLLEGGRILMAYSVAEDAAKTLRFAVSEDAGETWAPGRDIDVSETGSLRYPMMAVLPDGRIALTYSAATKTRVLVHILSLDWALAQ